jgi:hypothetical protein
MSGLLYELYIQRLVSMIFMSRLGHDMSICLKTDAYVFYVKTVVYDFYVKIRAWAWCTKTSVYILMSRLGPGLDVQRLVYTL